MDIYQLHLIYLHLLLLDKYLNPYIYSHLYRAFILYIKNPIAESHGVLGHYCIFELENTSTTPTELFAVESDIMKSYP